ncbi:CRISPR-associated endonuclease Cas1 1 [Candidatus Methanoplasma termitum]|uniref:CRISPR-associated endonuclease Cas1 n=1 Tax=Candidatus Methanoplasma termitum TaxID=1577791 RepID=A0A0A7LCG1_9ARCH|nr:type V CRISPR-associated endonuclease Cas1 [Candidatus Methanoplasma termitum]AIZ56870.1 CRISPR-associated endonuclease Cas1 1 [Candidatus Methanoplasma termitum]
MMSVDTFQKKQAIFVFTRDGDKISFSNDNLVVKNGDEVRLQSTCYRIFALFIVGDVTITSGIIQRSRKFGFPIFLMSGSFRTYDIIGHKTEGNYVLRKIQYDHDGLDIAKHIVENKIRNQIDTLKLQRWKDNGMRADISSLERYAESVRNFDDDFRGLMGIEGSASRIYFRNNFSMEAWTGRRPQIKADFINSTLDIGYTILFNFVDAMLELYGFDTYKGVYHREFYMRKSLVCDMVEPFRPLIDWQVRKAVNLGQCKPEDFNVSNGRFLLDISKNKDYVGFLMKPLLESKEQIFVYFQDFYRAIMKHKPISDFPIFKILEEE